MSGFKKSKIPSFLFYFFCRSFLNGKPISYQHNCLPFFALLNRRIVKRRSFPFQRCSVATDYEFLNTSVSFGFSGKNVQVFEEDCGGVSR